MFFIWWPAFVIPLLMVLCGLLGKKLPGLHYHSPYGVLPDEKQQLADRQLYPMLRQFGTAYAALAFMVMRSMRLIPENVQTWAMYAAFILEILGILLLVIPIERILQKDDEEKEHKGEES